MAFENLKIDFPSKQYDGYIFDCDGTIADSMTLHHRAWKEAFAEHGASFDYTWEIFFSLAGVGHEDTVRKMNARFGDKLDPAAVTRSKEEHYYRMVDDVLPITPVADFAKALAARGAKIAVASGGPRYMVERTLRAIGMEGMFDAVVTQDDISRSKPDPEIFLMAAQWLGVAPERCIVFEDSHLGIAGAKSAGMDWVLIPPTGAGA